MGENTKSIDLKKYKVKTEYSGVLAKDILYGNAVTSENVKESVVFYPDSNTFRFADGKTKYRICSEKLLAYE